MVCSAAPVMYSGLESTTTSQENRTELFGKTTARKGGVGRTWMPLTAERTHAYMSRAKNLLAKQSETRKATVS